MQSPSWWMDIIRSFLFTIDKLVYGLIETLYNLFIFVSDLTIFNDSDFTKFTDKVYLILGIVMLFKIAFTLINLFANPDDLMDSNKGITGIVKRIIISLIVITFVPTIFQTAYRIQTIITHDNIIGNFFLGDFVDDSNQEDSTEEINKVQQDAGKMVSFSVLSAFYYPEEFVYTKNPENPEEKVMEFTDGWFFNREVCVLISQDEEKCNGDLFNLAVKNNDINMYGAFVNKEHRHPTDHSKYYMMHYMYLVSTIAGIAVAWIFFGFCFDVAIRAVKLSVLQLIAPIPIFSYIDPKKGEEVFKKWYTTCITTYTTLFMRLILIFFVIYICYIIGSTNHGILQINAEGKAVAMQSNSLSGFAKVLIIFGVLYFAKSAPKLFSDMFGIKTDESFGTKIAKMGMAGTALAVGVGGAKYLGSKYRRGLQKGANRRKIDELQDKIDSGTATEEDIKEIGALRTQNRWREGLKQNMNATRFGITAGFAGGFKGGKVSRDGFNSSLRKAHDTEKIRNEGTSYVDQKIQKLNTLAGVQDKYGGFSKYKSDLKDFKNELHDWQIMENRLNETYSDMYSSIAKKYDLPSKDFADFNALIKKDVKESEDLEKLKEIRNKLVGDNVKIGEELDNLESYYKHVREANIRGKGIEKQIKSVESKINAVSESEK